MNISSSFIWLNLMLLWFAIMTVIFVLQIRDLIRMNKSIRNIRGLCDDFEQYINLRKSELKVFDAVNAKIKENKEAEIRDLAKTTKPL